MGWTIGKLAEEALTKEQYDELMSQRTRPIGWDAMKKRNPSGNLNQGLVKASYDYTGAGYNI